jgi:hypothetical protein
MACCFGGQIKGLLNGDFKKLQCASHILEAMTNYLGSMVTWCLWFKVFNLIPAYYTSFW